MTFTPEELREELFPAPTSSTMGRSPSSTSPPATTRRAADLARAAGALLSYDPNLRLGLWPSAEDARRGMREGMTHAQVVKVSEEELEFITGIAETERAARELLSDGAELVAVTAGARGCRFFTANAQGELPGFPWQPSIPPAPAMVSSPEC